MVGNILWFVEILDTYFKMDIEELILYNNAIVDLEEEEINFNNGRRQLVRGRPFEDVSEEQFVRMFR